jgi:hypothetical protein
VYSHGTSWVGVNGAGLASGRQQGRRQDDWGATLGSSTLTLTSFGWLVEPAPGPIRKYQPRARTMMMAMIPRIAPVL